MEENVSIKKELTATIYDANGNSKTILLYSNTKKENIIDKIMKVIGCK